MAYVLWSDMYLLRIPAIDSQHRKLFDITNAFHEAIRTEAADTVVFETLNSLIKYVEEHFRDEEHIMSLAKYPECEHHRKLHEKLAEDIFTLHAQLKDGDKPVIHDLEVFLNDWLVQHILVHDKSFSPYCTELKHYSFNRDESGNTQ